ncbi:hypothetical protein GW17_00053076, partial [Ensete ventricosum]
ARPEAPAESEEGAASPVHERPRSMKDLFRTKVYKGDQGYYALMMSDLGHQDPEKELQARWAGLRNSTKVWHTSSAAEEYERGILHPQLARRALAGGEMPTLPVPGRLYDTWRSSYNRSTSHVELVTLAAQVSEGVMTWQPGRHLSYQNPIC